MNSTRPENRSISAIVSMRRREPILRPALIFSLLLFSGVARGDYPSPRLDRISPLGAAAGTSVEVEYQASEAEETTSLWSEHPGITATKVEGKERRFLVRVAPEVPEGTYDLRLSGRFGISNPRLFAVSHALTDLAEAEPNNGPETAQAVPLESAVNGTSDGNGIDLFRLTLKKGERVSIDCQAQRLESLLDANLSLSASDGRILAVSSDYFGRDPFLDFVPPADGDYVVSLNDLSFRGGFPYRLVVSRRPHVENVFPRAIAAGQTVGVQLWGRNLGGAPVPGLAADPPLESKEISLAAPNDGSPGDGSAIGNYRFLEHPTGHSVLPTAATATLSGFQFRPNAGRESLNAVTMLIAESPVVVETNETERAQNDKLDSAQQVSLPTVLCGRFDRPHDADYFTFQATEAGTIQFEGYCERIAGQADPYIAVFDDQGNRIIEQDDFGHRMFAFDAHLRDPVGNFQVQAGKTYRVLIQDRYRRGGPRYQYVLAIRSPSPDFSVAAIHRQNPGPGGTTILRGGGTWLDLVIHQRDGHSEPIAIQASKLPPGLHAAATTITNDMKGAFVLWADADAPEWTGEIELTATSRRGDATIRRIVRPYVRVWNDGQGTSRPTRTLVAAIREQAPFSLTPMQEVVEVEAGQKAAVKFQTVRRPEFVEKLNVQPLNFPGQFQFATQEIAAGTAEFTAEIAVQGGTRPGDYTLALQGQGQVPFNKDPAAKERPNTLVTLPSRPFTLRVMPAAKPK